MTEADLERRVSAAETDLRGMADRLRVVEAGHMLSVEREKHIDRRFDAMERKVDAGFSKTDQMVNRIAWLIVAGIVTAVLKFIFDGGLSVPGG